MLIVPLLWFFVLALIYLYISVFDVFCCCCCCCCICSLMISGRFRWFSICVQFFRLGEPNRIKKETGKEEEIEKGNVNKYKLHH